jgi:YggT family protein
MPDAEMTMFDQALKFLLDTTFGLLTYAFLLRFAMQWMRAPFRNPVGHAVLALTDWAVKPVRRVIRGVGGFDASTLMLAWCAQFVWLLALHAISGAGGWGAMALTVLVLLAVVELIKAILWLLIIVVIAQAILSWTAPDGPLAGVLNALTFRFLAPMRRMIPPIGGTLDLSPLILIVLVQLLLMLPVRWLELAVLQIFR